MDLILTQDNSQVTFANRDTSTNLSPALQGTPGFSTDGNPAQPEVATQIPAYHYDMMVGELYNLLLAAGVVPSGASYSGVYQSILALGRAVDTGAVNAMAASPASALLTGLPALSAFPDGFSLTLIPANTTTSTSPTFNWNGGGAVGITYATGAALASGDIQIGQPVRLMKAGGLSPVWWLIDRPAGKSIDVGRRLVANLGTAGASVTFTADLVGVAASIGGPAMTLANFSETLNIATTGAGGMDTGTSPLSSFVAIYAIVNPTTGAAALLGTAACYGTVYTGSNMPSGYTMSGLLGVWLTNGSGQLIAGNIIDRVFYYAAPSQVLSGGTATSPTSVSLSSKVPSNARAVLAQFYAEESSSVTSGSSANFSPINAADNAVEVNAQAVGVVNIIMAWLPLPTPQTIYYYAGKATSLACGMSVAGYQI